MQPIRLRIEDAAAGGIDALLHALGAVPGVMSVRVDPARGDEVRVEASESLDPMLLVEAAQHAGYLATVIG
ncbi:MAG TPA: hypothetical protein VGA77_06545 [Propylenella sp.]|jgi:copper chaperone CopZ